jgi:hypothetical protein
MDFEMYGLGCAYCGRAVDSWRDGRTWPCCCPTATPGHPRPTAIRRATAATGPRRRPLPRELVA